ncbi:MAG: hypothetical protein JST85_24180 [Acidobacteria bacterium]|nr:hypothetical protein [Acidobacteriota bacterium]
MGELYYNSTVLRNYLLEKQLSEAERDKLEEEYFCKNELFIALLDAKDELIRDYWNENLTAEDRLRFERCFLSQPSCKQEVELARFFRPSTAITNPSIVKEAPSWWSGLLGFAKAHQVGFRLAAATAMVMLVAGAWLSWHLLRSSPIQEFKASLPNSQLAQGQEVVFLNLKPRSLRSLGKDTTAKIGRITRAIELKLEVGPEPFQSYQASVRNKAQESVEILKENLPGPAKEEAGKPIVVLQIPAVRLQPGDYLVKLSGIGADEVKMHIGSYDFEVRNHLAENFQTGR